MQVQLTKGGPTVEATKSDPCRYYGEKTIHTDDFITLHSLRFPLPPGTIAELTGISSCYLTSQ
eukprot:2947630-Amphidinium_carterae.1